MCTNKVAIETHSRTRGAKRRAFGRPAEQVTLERSERRGGLLFVVPVDSPVDSTFERSENFAIAHTVSSSSCYKCYWPVMRGVAYVIIESKFVPLASAHAHINQR